MTSESLLAFDEIHTRTKQENLDRMMEQVAERVHEIKNDSRLAEACPICREPDYSSFAHRFGFQLDRCHGCNHIFCNPMPNKAQLDCYYNSSMKAFENQFFLESFENRVPIFSRRIEIILEHLEGGKLLDVGSAVGIFLAALDRADAPFDVHCCDPSKDACDRLRLAHPNISLHQKMIEELDMPGVFDAVTMWDTLEHIRDPHEVATAVRRCLKSGGLWFFSTPNTQRFEWSIEGTDHVQILPPGHINLFNLKSIEVLLKNVGFELLDAHTLNGFLDVTYVRKLLAQGKSEYLHRAGTFIADRINDDDFCQALAGALVASRLGGNILIVAKRSD